MTTDDRRCICRYTHVEGISKHEPGCPMLLPPPVVKRDPYRAEHPVAEVCGGAVTSVEFTLPLLVMQPAQSARLENLGTPVDRDAIETLPNEPLGRIRFEPLALARGAVVVDEWVLLQPEEQRLIGDIKQGETAGELRAAIDRFVATVRSR